MSNVKSTVKKAPQMSDAELMGLLDRLVAEGGQELSLERQIYKPEVCGNMPVVGYLLDILQMPAADREENPNWKAFLIRLSHETNVVNRSGDVVRARAGEEIILPASHQLAVNLARFALNPTEMTEVGIQPKEQIKIGGGKKMWTFRVVATGKSEERTSLYKLSEKIAAASEAPMLGQGVTGNGTVFDTKTGEVIATPAS
jgi:hypothetical protein